MHPSIPRSIMKQMCMYEKRICFLKIKPWGSGVGAPDGAPW